MQKIINEKIENEKKHNFYLSSFGLIIFTIYICTQSLIFDSILKNNILQIGIVFLAFLFIIFSPQKDKVMKFSFTKFDLIWTITVMFLLLFIFQNYSVERNNELFVYVCGLLLLLIAKLDVERFIPTFKIFKFISIIYSFTTIFHYAFTDVFHSFIFPFISSTAQQRMKELVYTDYYPGLGIAQPSMAAAIMIIGIGIIIINIIKEEKPTSKMDLVYLVILFSALNLTGKRSVLLWCILASIFLYYFSVESREKLNKMIKIFLFSITIIVMTIFIINIFKETSFFANILSTIEGLFAGEDVTSGRIVLYARAWELFLEYPLFGIGWGQFIKITSGQLLSRDLSVHNVYLQLLAETGFVGFILVILPIVFTYAKTLKYVKICFNTDCFNKKWKWVLSFSLYYQTFFLLYCLTENPFYNIVYMFVYFYSLAITNSFFIKNINELRR